MEDKKDWILCPACGNKTHLKIRKDTILENFQLYCPKRKQDTILYQKEKLEFVKEGEIQL